MGTNPGTFGNALSMTIALLFALTTTGCATMNVSSHVQRGLDFTQYRTYDWGPADALPTGDSRLDQDGLFQDQVQGAVDRRLAARGLEQASGAPDLLIHYHASVTRSIDVNRIDGDAYCYDEDCRIGAVEFEAGTLVLDIVDARSKEVIWRGWAQQDVGNLLDDRDRMSRRIDEAVARMLERLPASFGSRSRRLQGGQ